MTSHVSRLYALAGTLVVFFGTWAGVAASPWGPRQADTRVASLQRRELRLRQEAAATQELLDRRWADYRDALAQRRALLAARRDPSPPASPRAPSVRVVTLPPVTTTRSS